MEPKYLAGEIVELSALEKLLLQERGCEHDFPRWLRAHKDHQAVLRLVFSGAGRPSFQVATLFIESNRILMEYLGYKLTSQENERIRLRGPEPDPATLLHACKVWRVAFSADVRNWVANELNSVNILAMKSCEPGWGGPMTSIPVCWEMLEDTRDLVGGGSLRVFFAMRDADGEVVEHQLRASQPNWLADVRYERLIFCARWCEPLSDVLSLFQKPFPRVARPSGLPVFGFAPAPEPRRQREGAMPASSRRGLSSLVTVSLFGGPLLGVVVGVILGARFARSRGSGRCLANSS